MKTGELFPRNLARLEAEKVRFQRQRGSHTLVVTCPRCNGRMLLDESRPFHVCFGPLWCSANRDSFDEIIVALAERREAA
jgi:hypothetical protein